NLSPVPQLFITKWHRNAVRNHPISTWLIWIAVLTLVLATAIVFMLLTQNYTLRKTSFWIAVLVFLSILPIVYTAISSNRYWNHPNEAIIMTTMVNIKGSPDKGSVDKFMLHSGSKVIIEDQIGTWLKVRAIDGNTGWLEEKDLSKIE
ncbi:MAG: SH3 domain-containing protein, partial [Bacteroidota bacterium]|nr:SH3 domain-containing protein [Bacteroidota bacterium]